MAKIFVSIDMITKNRLHDFIIPSTLKFIGLFVSFHLRYKKLGQIIKKYFISLCTKDQKKIKQNHF